MTSTDLADKAENYLHHLCLEIPNRCVGSAGNRAATDFFADTVAASGFETECPTFDCFDWHHGAVRLTVDDTSFAAFVSPYAPGCAVTAPLTVIATIEELAAAEIADRIILLHSEIAREQLMPKNFPFYNPESHQRIIALLEQKRPQAIIAATTRNPQLAGAVYPFPLIEDGDFDIPSVYIKDVEGERLAAHAGREVSLEFKADRTPATGCNVIARKGTDFSRRVVLFAHIDAKQGTPGALDNGTGVVTLLLLAERLADYSGDLGIEIVALNGEDYYSAPGEQQWIARNTGKFTEIVLGINLDGAGYQHGNTAYSLYDPPPEIAVIIWEVFSGRQNMVEGDPWYQSDHSLFIQKGRPALAITSDRFDDLWTRIAHTPDDRPEIVDYAKLIDISAALLDLLRRLDGHVEQ